MLDDKWARFKEHHEDLRRNHWNQVKTLDYLKNGHLDITEGIYLDQRTMLMEMISELRAKKVIVAEESRPRTIIPGPPKSVLPKVNIPRSSGQYEEWPLFRDLFGSLVIYDLSFSDVTRMYYLKSNVEGETEQLLRKYSTTDENFAAAWAALTDFYENTRLVVRSFYSLDVNLPKMKTSLAADLRRLYHSMTGTMDSLKGIGRPITSSEDLFVHFTIGMLDPKSRFEWEEVVKNTAQPPTYVELKTFLEKRLHLLESVLPEKSSAEQRLQERSTKPVRSHVSTKAAPSTVKDDRKRCALCRKNHFLMRCDAYKKKTAAKRKAFVESSGLCHNCLGNHPAANCFSQRNCAVCSDRHHTSLHDACRATSDVNTSIAFKSSHIIQRSREVQVAVLLATARVHVTDHMGATHRVRVFIDQGSETSFITETLAQRLRLLRMRGAVAVFGVGGCH
ncbi:uncharacterized protein [Cardiocondyla obscurior]|uniref:uncharacterized protein n=1 Tax=Cardiocondyla obscurior TaxID=286306 RepID=UPI0039657B96